MKRLKKQSVLLWAVFMIVSQIGSLQAMEYEAMTLTCADRGMFRREQLLTPTETPFSWFGCFGCFTWYNEEKTDNSSTQGSEWNIGNSLKNEVVHPAD